MGLQLFTSSAEKDAPATPFGSANLRLRLEHTGGTMDAPSFLSLVESALIDLLTSDEYEHFIASGQKAAQDRQLSETGSLVTFQGDVGTQARSLRQARQVAVYAVANDASIHWS